MPPTAPTPTPTLALAAARSGESWAFDGIYAALAGHVRRFVAAQGAADPDARVRHRARTSPA